MTASTATHHYSHARAPVLAAEAVANLALHEEAVAPAAVRQQAVAALERLVANPATSGRLYAPALQALKRLAVSRPRVVANHRAQGVATQLVLDKLVDEQTNRGWS